MAWARVWGKVMRILNFISEIGDTVISITASRMVRDSDEFRRRAHPRRLAKGFLILDMILTLLFIVLAVVTLALSENEKPAMPLRLWLVVFVIYCVIHIPFTIVEYKGGRNWWQLRSTIFNARNLEYVKNAFGIFWWGIGMYFMVKGSDRMYAAAPKLTWILTFFMCFDIALAICFMLLLFGAFLVFCCSLPILCATFYYIGNQQLQGRVVLPPCPWCCCE